MKKLLFIILLLPLFALAAGPTNHYVDAVAGNDANAGTIGSPWKTITRVNTSFNVFVPGDSVLFKRGQTFYGSIIANRSGTAALPIVIGAYGTGANPVISGFTTVSSWTSAAGGVYYSNVAGATLNTMVVTIDNNLQRMGRYPNYDASNGGYLIDQTTDTIGPSVTTTDARGMSTVFNWTGAEVVIRKVHWILDRCKVLSHNLGTIKYSNPNDPSGQSTYKAKAGFGFFIQNDIRTLDQFGEWFMDKGTKNLSVYFGANNPASYSVKVSTIDTLLKLSTFTYITINGLSFEGANQDGGTSRFGGNIKFLNCSFNNVYEGISTRSITNPTFQYNYFTNILNNAITVSDQSSTQQLITNDTLKNIGLFAGMGGSGDGMYIGIYQLGNNATIQYNQIDSVGYDGIAFGNNNILVQYNFVNHFCIVKDDGGGIYGANGFTQNVQSNREISYNVVINGIGATNGTPNFTIPGTTNDAHAFYIDAQSNHAYVHHNSVSGMPNGAAIFFNSANDCQARYNTWYNVKFGMKMERLTGTNLNRNILYTSNTVYPTLSNFLYFNGDLNTPSTISLKNDVRNVFTISDSNYYRNNISRQFDWTSFPSENSVPTPGNFSQWQSFIGGEAHSFVINPDSAVDFQYNPTSAPVTYSFPGLSKRDLNDSVYNNAATIPRNGSILFFANGFAPSSNLPPTANAGKDTSTTLPTNSIMLTGSGSDPDGTISAYSWQILSGPPGASFGSASSASTTFNNLTDGTFILEFTVTDNNGATGSDQVTIVVNQAASTAYLIYNLSPVP